MDSFEWNKVAGAILMTLLIIVVIGHIGDILVPESEAGAKQHIEVAGAPAAATQPTQQAKAPAELQPIEPFLAKANIEEGKKDARICETCHNFQKGKGPKIGPDLWGIVGAKIARREDFHYSDAIKKLSGDWTVDQLNKWIDAPQKVAPGTKMTFAGIKDEQKRANVIAFLNSLSDSPKPLPTK